jgi:hypothetical protein
MTGNAVIVVDRPKKGYRDMLRAYKVLVDGQVAGEVRRGQQIRIEVPAGQHEVQMAIDWTTSPSGPLNLAPGEQAVLVCRPGGSAATAGIDMIFNTDSWIALERVS